MNITDLSMLNFRQNQKTHYRSAIAVYLMSSSDYEKVGYVVSDLAKYLHPLLKDPSL